MQEEIKAFISANPDVKEVDLIIMDIPGNFYGKRYAITDLEKLAVNGLKFPRGMPLMSVQGHAIDALGHGIDDGDPDASIELVPGSLRRVGWESEPRAQVMVTYTQGEEDSPFWEPRTILKKVLSRFVSSGYRPVVAFELEFYLFDLKRTPDGLVQAPLGQLTGQRDTYAVMGIDRLADFGKCLSDISRTCAEQGVDIGPASAEVGLGQYEINLVHNSDVMEAADQCAMFRRIVKGVALKHGFQASFMAKPYIDDAGNGLHLHVSVYDEAGNNLLAADDDKKLLHAVAGVLKLMPESLSIFAPNVNAFRRLKPGNNVPIGPTWGYENRSVAVRVPESEADNRRIEYRVGGADGNPYLTLAALLAGMHNGMEKELDPGAPTEELSEDSFGLPTDLLDALYVTEESEVLKEYLGSEFVAVYCAQKRSEFNAYEAAISAREYDWYL